MTRRLCRMIMKACLDRDIRTVQALYFRLSEEWKERVYGRAVTMLGGKYLPNPCGAKNKRTRRWVRLGRRRRGNN